jgi:PKD repeat protein
MQQQQPTFYGGTGGPPPTTQQRVSGTVASRLQYVILVVLMVALVIGSLYWLQWSSQRGLALGYPKPTVHILSNVTTVLDNTSTDFSADATGRDVTYAWNFGDNTGANGVAVSHSFSTIGNFTVTVTVTDAIGQTSTDTSTITVTPQPPTASFTWRDLYPGYGYYEIQFDASGSQPDTNTSIASYNWNFGDGYTTQTTGPSEYYTYSGPNTYTVSLTVTDATGQTSQAYTQSVTVS